MLKGNRAYEIVGCPQVVYDRIFANRDANKDKMIKLRSVKSNDAKTGDAATKRKSKSDVSSATQRKSSGVDMASKRKRDDEAEGLGGLEVDD